MQSCSCVGFGESIHTLSSVSADSRLTDFLVVEIRETSEIISQTSTLTSNPKLDLAEPLSLSPNPEGEELPSFPSTLERFRLVERLC